MKTSNRSVLVPAAIVIAALALVAAGCGGDNDNGTSGGGGGVYGGSGGGGTKAPASTGGAGVVSVADNPKLGSILVDSKGNTLYYFLKDKKGKSAPRGDGRVEPLNP